MPTFSEPVACLMKVLLPEPVTPITAMRTVGLDMALEFAIANTRWKASPKFDMTDEDAVRMIARATFL
jgi:hypothetical protein